MIRINLLPQKRKAERSESRSQLWLVAVLILFLIEVGGLFVFHGWKGQELEEQKRKNSELSAQIERSRKAVSDHNQVKEKLASLRSREAAIAQLQSARTGPTAILLELARILTAGRGPTADPDRLTQLRRENPLAVFNPAWDTRRLWITSFVERSRQVRVDGLARDGEDVSEFARRLHLSSFFQDVKLLPARKERHPATGLELVRFSLEAQVRY